MGWWQITLILLASSAVGAAVGAFLSYLILRFIRKRRATYLSNSISQFNIKPEVTPLPIKQAETTYAQMKEDTEVPLVPVEKTGPAISAPLTGELLTELKQNSKIADEPLGDELLSFQTSVWDAHQYKVDRLPSNLRDDLEQAYTDMRLANSLVWLSTEFNHRSPSLNENYTKLRVSISERLHRIDPLIEQE